jgi:non-specific serine/threonine protein kinase/serine/threonine-protein kinase
MVMGIAFCLANLSAAQQAAPLSPVDPNAIMGFESPTGWSARIDGLFPDFAVASTTTRTQGSAAFAVNNPPRLLTLTSRPVASTATALTGIGNSGAVLQLDILLPSASGAWKAGSDAANDGWIIALVSSRSRGLFLAPLGQRMLRDLRTGTYNTVSFTIPDRVSSALGGNNFSDLVFEFVMGSPKKVSGAYVFDNLRVHSVDLVQSPSGDAPPAGYGGSLDLVIPGDAPVSQSFDLGPTQIPAGFHLKKGTAGSTTVQFALGLDSKPTLACTYNPDGADASNQSYILESCTGANVAGDLVSANWINVAIQGGDSSQEIHAQIALSPLGDRTGSGLIPAMPTFWGDADACLPAPVPGTVVTTSTSCLNQTSQANKIITDYFNQVHSSNPAPNWIVAPVPESATRHGDGTPTDKLTGRPISNAVEPLDGAAPNSDPPFDTGGDLNPGGSFDAYWRLSGNLNPTAVPGTDENLTHFDAAFTAHGVLFGDDIDVVDAKLTADTDSGATTPVYKPATSSGTLNFYVLGEEIPSGGLPFNPSTGFSVDPSWNQEYNLPSVHVWIFTITLGATVDADLNAQGSAALSGADLSVIPTAAIGGHISGGIDLGIASGTVDAKVNLLTVSTPVSAQVKWVIHTEPNVCATTMNGSLKGDLNLSSGGGQVNLDATFGDCPFCYTDSYTLFKWKPLASASWNLFSDTIDTQLFELPTSLCTYPITVNIPAVDLIQPERNATAPSWVGRRLGPYQIVAEIGHGGMGEVYSASRIDGQFDQQVAIKIVRVGMGSAFMVDRFLHERQILATLNHPNIARLLDGGATHDGVPYLVMELVDGRRIDAYCQANSLSITARLRVFLQVCAAVEYAHQRLVIHRDIKPGNILVSNEGSPKLLDFGIAKILDPSGDSDTTVARPMTPEYASPEQIRGEPITTATDVYSLGVVLYQLLTGRSPYRVSRPPSQWSHVVTNTDPQRPSSAVVTPVPSEEGLLPAGARAEPVLSSREPTPARLRRRLSGDLDDILLMALRKEPERRYRSVQQFADDITSHLAGLPVTASKGSWSYAAGKFVSRHRAAVAATALVILALLAGIVATDRQARIAQIERAKAQKRFDDVRQFSNSLIFDIHDALQDIPGTTPARNLLLDRAVQYLDRVAKDADGDSDLQRELAWAYQRLATVQGDATVSNMGQVSAAELSSQKALALFEAVAKANPKNTVDQLNVAMIHRQKGYSDLYYPAGRPEIEKALEVTDRLMRTDGGNSRVRIERAIELQVLGDSLNIWGERRQSAVMFRQSLDLVQAVAQQDPGYSRIRERLAKTHVKLGYQLALAGTLDEGRKEIETGIDLYANLLQQGGRPDMIRDQAQSRYRLGFVQALRGDLAAAETNFRLVRDAEAPLAKADAQNMMLRMDLISTDFEPLRILILKGRFRQAEPALAKLIAAYEILNSEENSGPGTEVLYQWLGEAQFGQGKHEQALKSFKKSLEILAGNGGNDDAICGIMTAYIRTGDILLKLARTADAEAAYRSALAKSAPASAINNADLPALLLLAAAHAGLGNLKFASAAVIHNPAEQDALRRHGCDEYSEARNFKQHIPVSFAFSPVNFPAPRVTIASLEEACANNTSP